MGHDHTHHMGIFSSGIAYVQGMNEILGPIYYTFVTDSKESEVQHAEADAFFCFTGQSNCQYLDVIKK